MKTFWFQFLSFFLSVLRLLRLRTQRQDDDFYVDDDDEIGGARLDIKSSGREIDLHFIKGKDGMKLHIQWRRKERGRN